MILDHPADIERWREAGWWGTTTIDDLFRACVAQVPQQLALVDAPNREKFAAGRPRDLTFAEVDGFVDRLAATLYAAGVRKDDVVLVQLPNIVEIVITYLACIRLGAIVSPIMLAYGARDVRRIVRHVRPAAIVTLAEYKGARPAAVGAHDRADHRRRPLQVLAIGEDDRQVSWHYARPTHHGPVRAAPLPRDVHHRRRRDRRDCNGPRGPPATRSACRARTTTCTRSGVPVRMAGPAGG